MSEHLTFLLLSLGATIIMMIIIILLVFLKDFLKNKINKHHVDTNRKTIKATRCYFVDDEYDEFGLAHNVSKIGYQNILQILPCYNGGEKYFYTIIYEEEIL